MKYKISKIAEVVLPSNPYKLYGNLFDVVYHEGKNANLLGLSSNDNPYSDEFPSAWSLKDIWLLGWNDVKNA